MDLYFDPRLSTHFQGSDDVQQLIDILNLLQLSLEKQSNLEPLMRQHFIRRRTLLRFVAEQLVQKIRHQFPLRLGDAQRFLGLAFAIRDWKERLSRFAQCHLK